MSFWTGKMLYLMRGTTSKRSISTNYLIISSKSKSSTPRLNELKESRRLHLQSEVKSSSNCTFLPLKYDVLWIQCIQFKCHNIAWNLFLSNIVRCCLFIHLTVISLNYWIFCKIFLGNLDVVCCWLFLQRFNLPASFF